MILLEVFRLTQRTLFWVVRYTCGLSKLMELISMIWFGLELAQLERYCGLEDKTQQAKIGVRSRLVPDWRRCGKEW